MSMGYSASRSVMIPNDKIGEFIGKAAADKLLDMLSKVEGWEVIDTNQTHIFTPDNYTGEIKGVKSKAAFLKKLDTAVNKALDTIRKNTGITAYLSYHSTDDGDCYDEVDGFFIELAYDECFVSTPKFHKLEKSGLATIANYVVAC